jgi:hypothetical protein
MFHRRNPSAERLGLRGVEQRAVEEARRKDAEHREMMLEAMRGLGFEACHETYVGHMLGRPDATAEQKHDALQRAAREAWRDIEPR